MRLAIALAAVLALAQAPPLTPLTKAEQLQDAARKGDAAAVRTLLDEGVDVYTKFRYNSTALIYACDHGHVEVVKLLLDRGADMNVKDTFYGFTPLMLATSPAQKKKPEHTEIAKLLIARGSPGKEMALSGAIESGDASLVKVILDSGGLSAASLTDALETARAVNKPDLAAMLEQAGAKPFEDFKVDPALLAKLPGTYRAQTGSELTIAAAGLRLTIGQAGAPPAQRITLVATGETAFKAIGPPISITFQVEGARVVSLTLLQSNIPPTVFSRVEGKQP